MTPANELRLFLMVATIAWPIALKTAIWLSSAVRPSYREYLKVPVFSLREAMAIVHDGKHLARWDLALRACVWGMVLALAYLMLRPILWASTPPVVWSIVAWWYAFAWVEMVSSLYRFIMRLAGYSDVGLLVVNPFATTSMRQFFAVRWNRPMGTWLKELVDQSRHKTVTLVLIFFLQGVIHELSCNLPTYLWLHVNVFGTHMLAFGICCAGVILDGKLAALRQSLGIRGLRFLLFVLCVYGTAPWFCNVGLLTAFWLWPIT